MQGPFSSPLTLSPVQTCIIPKQAVPHELPRHNGKGHMVTVDLGLVMKHCHQKDHWPQRPSSRHSWLEGCEGIGLLSLLRHDNAAPSAVPCQSTIEKLDSEQEAGKSTMMQAFLMLATLLAKPLGRFFDWTFGLDIFAHAPAHFQAPVQNSVLAGADSQCFKCGRWYIEAHRCFLQLPPHDHPLQQLPRQLPPPAAAPRPNLATPS